MMRTIVLYGAARKQFGPSFRLDVSSLAEAVRAIGMQVDGFKKFIEAHDFIVTLRRKDKSFLELEEEHVAFNLPAGDIVIKPVLRGSGGKGGIFKIIGGLVLAAVAWWALPAIGLGGGILGLSTGQIAMLGVGLAVTGLSSMLTKQPKAPEKWKDEGFTLSGAINVSEQGVPVPLIYGETKTGSIVISAGITIEDIPVEREDLEDEDHPFEEFARASGGTNSYDGGGS